MVAIRKISVARALGAVAAAGLLASAGPIDAKKFTLDSGKKWTVKVGPIWNQADAEVKCRKAARREGGKWTGEWWTTKPGRMSVCQLRSGGGSSKLRTVNAGPIWNQADAEVKCPIAARSTKARWTGQWWTTIPGQMSVCLVRPR